ncbi:hypothetical protein ACFY4C_27125 [Actinomadura viridis]|uniref:hypothetical protein n=1 Tax=Actinomadura viridis TaxID=58110 RepID=UPI0036D034EC
MALVYFFLNENGRPRFRTVPEGDEKYRALGAWMIGEMGTHLGVCLDALANVDDAAAGRPVEPWSSESFDTTISASGIRFRNFYAVQECGAYTLDELRSVVEDYWRFLCAIPEPPGAYREYWPELPRPEAEVLLWERVWKRRHPYRGRLF